MVQLTSKMQLLAMDFDGVIADSILECAVVGYNGYEIYCSRSQMIKTPDEIKSDRLNKFRIMRPYIRSGEDYIYLFQAIDDGIFIRNQEEFDNFRNDHLDRRDLYYQIFYSTRKMMMKSDYKNWIKLNSLYDGMNEFLNSKRVMIHIVSTKASKYIIEILKSNEIEFDLNYIHEAGRMSSKTNIIIGLLKNHHLLARDLIFIDDHLDTLHKVESTGVRCFLAGWGYNTVKQRNKCNDLNLELVDIQQFYKEF